MTRPNVLSSRHLRVRRMRPLAADPTRGAGPRTRTLELRAARQAKTQLALSPRASLAEERSA